MTKNETFPVPCELCEASTSLKDRVRHMSRYMEDIALFALGTWEEDEDIEDEIEDDSEKGEELEGHPPTMVDIMKFYEKNAGGRDDDEVWHKFDHAQHQESRPGMNPVSSPQPAWATPRELKDMAEEPTADRVDQKDNQLGNTAPHSIKRVYEERLSDYFLDGEGISREVIEADICRYLGSDASVRPTVHQGRPGYLVTAFRNLISNMIVDLKAESERWNRGLKARYSPSERGYSPHT